MSKLQAL